jgi:hypothetical protein
MAQVADLYVWLLAIAGYDEGNRAHGLLRTAGRLFEWRLPEPKSYLWICIGFTLSDWATLSGSVYHNIAPDVGKGLIHATEPATDDLERAR